jgi:hypothetical protein
MKRIIGLGVAVLVVAAVWTGAWLWAAGQIETYVRSMADNDGSAAPRLVCASLGVGGFPFAFDVTCGDAMVSSGDITVTAKGLKATAEVYNPTHVLVFAQSPVSFADAFTGSQSRLDFAALQASARLSGWRVGRVSVVLEQPVWNDTVLGDRLLASAEHLEAHLVDDPAGHDAAKGLAALAAYARIEGLVAPGFEVAAGEASFEGEVTGLGDDVRRYGDADMLRRWQAAGGRFELSRFTGSDGANRFDASGTFGLDSDGRLEGQLKVTSTGLVERFGTAIPEAYRGLVVGARQADGSYVTSVNIAAGVVFSGVVPAAMIPPLF